MRSLNESHISQNWDSFKDYLRRRLRGVLTGIEGLDKFLLGLGNIVVLQGDTGCNKSTLALQILHHNLLLGNPGIIIDKENGEGRLRSRLLCQTSKKSETTLLASSDDEILPFAARVAALPLHIYTEALRDFDAIALRVGEAFSRYPNRPLIVLIDSLQALTPVDADQRVNLEKWMYFFDELKVAHNGRLTIIITSETKRAGYGTEDGIGRGKGTNAIEFKAETLLDMRQSEREGEVELLVAKHRDGIKGARFNLEKVLADRNNNRSFVFLMKEALRVEL